MLDHKTLIENLENVIAALENMACHAMAQDVRDAVAEIDRLTLRWTSDKPKVPGRYFMRMKDAGGNGTLCILDDQWLRESDEWFGRREWAGPMVDPLEPTPETGAQS